jgi:hypothetical protein
VLDIYGRSNKNGKGGRKKSTENKIENKLNHANYYEHKPCQLSSIRDAQNK